MNKIISFQMMGGIGNILFSFATAYSLSKKYNLNLRIFYNHIGYLHTDPKFYSNNIFKNFEEILNINEFSIYNYMDFPYKEVNVNKTNNIFLNGYFQSEKYFSNYNSELYSIILNNGNFDKNLKNKYFINNGKENVSVHIRRGNYLQLSNYHEVLDINYYNEALNKFNDCNIFVFSDDIEYCKNHFNNRNFNFIENSSDIEDLYLMSLCDHNIIANSTFSWWGAWLNQNQNKKIIAPKKWFGIDNSNIDTKDLIPNTWIKL